VLNRNFNKGKRMKLSAYIEQMQGVLERDGDFEVFGSPLLGRSIGGYSGPNSESGTLVRTISGEVVNVPNSVMGSGGGNHQFGMGVTPGHQYAVTVGRAGGPTSFAVGSDGRSRHFVASANGGEWIGGGGSGPSDPQ
jgi:hypothetical protein